MSEPRELTGDEVREEFLSHVRAMVRYWATQPEGEGCRTVQDRCEGVAFSILCALDGCAGELPAFTVTPAPHPSDQAYHQKQGENWYPSAGDIAGGLHELLHK
jgi:hypothetical protein